MKRILFLISLVFFLVVTPFLVNSVEAVVSVKGYFKSNGTYVQPYYRSSPNSTKFDNFSTKGNTNPYTGKVGTKNPFSPLPAITPKITPKVNNYIVPTLPKSTGVIKPKTNIVGPTALCKDGTYSYSFNHQGTCSGHKGVSTFYK